MIIKHPDACQHGQDARATWGGCLLRQARFAARGWLPAQKSLWLGEG
ncbi:MAG: hypothetical protein KGZ49_06770 [Syntrophaceae bacterium]|nr:hypothetical protein [Syntrophaceae bacterium]